MIRELINFVNDLEQDYPEVFDLNKTPSPGLHLWIELDDEGNWKNNSPIEGEDYVIYDGKEIPSSLFNDATNYWEQGRTIGGATNTNKCVSDKKIHSCSPFIFAFKNENFGHINNKIIKTYFKIAQAEYLEDTDVEYIETSEKFANTISLVFDWLISTKIEVKKRDKLQLISILKVLKTKDYINLYIRNIDLNYYKIVHEKYLNTKLFNNNDYCIPKNVPIDKSKGLSNFINGANKKKMFMEHKTGLMIDGINTRISMDDAKALNKFEILSYQKAFPTPLPVIIDKQEFKFDEGEKITSTEIVKLFDAEGSKRTLPQILKSLFDTNPQRVLANYYLLYINGSIVYDFDFVSKFEYLIKVCNIQNLFAIKNKEKELLPTQRIHTIFGFENKIVKEIFNNSLVRIKDGIISYNYFNEINPKFIKNGGEEMASLILRYRKAFYDFIYKSRKQAITTLMFDKLMLFSILLDVKQDEGYNRDIQIKKKLNIWFSLNQFFINHNSINMATQFNELMKKMDLIANNDNIQLDQSLPEFLFATGQVIYYLLYHNKADKPSHAMLEPFLQKATVEHLQNAITNTVNVYKHEISFGKGRFERLCAQVLAYSSDENIKNSQRYLLAGYFAPAVIFYKNEK
ncbi:hypothetical protein GM418_28625 [Maribellus comscasis]|uniref:Uncharacterized protein n=1 Tax=Maribellus comscasis TaxID=2681766 RepID=A0A6I6K771_9BACT|nr:hypothetical protein [Maribellus comscasis]QGY47493.1 hypothetical protein GM418_28625 [Maribellus comscasis]